MMVRFLSSRKKKLLSLAALPILIVVGLVIFTVKALNSPAEGVIANTKTYDSFSKETTDDLPQKYSDKYISFTYPAKYKEGTVEKNTGFLSNVSLLSTDHSSRRIAIGVYKGNINNESGISLRKSKPEIYKLIKSTPNMYVFKKSQNDSEYTGFIQHNDLVLSIAITTPFKKDLGKDYDTIANSLTWK